MNLHVPETLARELRALAHDQSEACARIGVAAVVSPTRVAHQLLEAGIAHARQQREAAANPHDRTDADAFE